MSRFENRPVTENQIVSLRVLQEAFQTTEGIIDANCPAGRYKSLAITYLEIAAMMANKAVMHPES